MKSPGATYEDADDASEDSRLVNSPAERARGDTAFAWSCLKCVFVVWALAWSIAFALFLFLTIRDKRS